MYACVYIYIYTHILAYRAKRDLCYVRFETSRSGQLSESNIAANAAKGSLHKELSDQFDAINLICDSVSLP